MRKTLTYLIAVRFAVLVTATTVAVLAVGGWLLDRQSMRGLEMLHETEGRELAELIGTDDTLTNVQLSHRIDHDADSDAALFFIQVHNVRGEVLYRSDNLGDAILPDLSGMEMHWTTQLPGLGDVRVSEFHAGPWHIQVASALTPTRRLLREYARVSGVLVLGVAVASLAIGYGFSRVTLRPIRAIEETAKRIRGDNLRERIPVPASRNELTALVLLLNQTFDRLEASFEQVKRFTADASHELKTPLAVVRLNAERLRETLSDDVDTAAALGDLLEEVERMNRIIESLLFLAKAESGVLPVTLKPHDMGALIATFAEDARAITEDRGQTFVLARNDPGEAPLEPHLWRQLLLNLVDNASSLSPHGATIALSAERTEAGWKFTVTDEGPGLPPAELQRVFERFVRYEHGTRAGERRGHGLGLAICRSIAGLHGGAVSAENRTDRPGLRVSATLAWRGAAA